MVKTPSWERRPVYRYGFVALILIVWEIVGPFISPIFFSYPSLIAIAFYDLTISGDLPLYLVQSLEVMLYGPERVTDCRHSARNRHGAVSKAGLGARPADQRALRDVTGRGGSASGAVVLYLKAKIIVVFLFAAFPVLINTYQGVRECDKNMLEVARSFRSSEWRKRQDVLLPFAVPYIIAGIRLAIGAGRSG